MVNTNFSNFFIFLKKRKKIPFFVKLIYELPFRDSELRRKELVVRDKDNINKLPEKLICDKFILQNLKNLQYLPEFFFVNNFVLLTRLPNVEIINLPFNMNNKTQITIGDCLKLTTIRNEVTIYSLSIFNCFKLEKISDKIVVDTLSLTNLSNLVDISNITVVSSLVINGCNKIKIPENLKVERLEVYNCNHITTLPSTIQIEKLFTNNEQLKRKFSHLMV